MNESPAFLLFLAVGCSVVFVYFVIGSFRATRYGIERKRGLPNITRHNMPIAYYSFVILFWFGTAAFGYVAILCIHLLTGK
jgi:hypothetical protein